MASMSVSAPRDDKVSLTFNWLGVSRKLIGRCPLDVKVVELTFKDWENKARVLIPENLPANAVRQISFQYRDSRQPHLERPVEALHLSVEQIQNLVIKAGIFESNQHRNESFIRSDSEVPLKLPKDKLEMGQAYRLEIESEDLSLAARIVKDFPVEREKIYNSLSAVLLSHISSYLQRLGAQLPPIDMPIISNFGDAGWAALAIQLEIKILKEETLLELVKYIRSLETNEKRSSAASMDAAVMEIVDNVNLLYLKSARKYLSLVGERGIANIMSRYLHSIFLDPIPAEVAKLIDLAVIGFTKGYVEYCEDTPLNSVT